MPVFQAWLIHDKRAKHRGHTLFIGSIPISLPLNILFRHMARLLVLWSCSGLRAGPTLGRPQRAIFSWHHCQFLSRKRLSTLHWLGAKRSVRRLYDARTQTVHIRCIGPYFFG